MYGRHILERTSSVQMSATKIMKGLRKMEYEERLRRMEKKPRWKIEGYVAT